MDRWREYRSPVTLSDWHSVERRIGNRSIVAGELEVRWVTNKKRSPEWLGQIVEVSVTGAAIHAASQAPVEVGREATIRYGQGESVVSVVHAEGADRPDTTAFAVEFVELDEGLRQRIYEILRDGRPYEDSIL
ncbi:MAG TPA: PilZ domain-containing protein [Acidimicrobiales bacterium]